MALEALFIFQGPMSKRGLFDALNSPGVKSLCPRVGFMDRNGLAIKANANIISKATNDHRFKHDAFAWKQQHKPVGDWGSHREPKSCPFIGQILN
jgi:hypothetical protein